MLKYSFLSVLVALLVQTSSAQCPCTPQQIQDAINTVLSNTDLVGKANEATKDITLPRESLPPQKLSLNADYISVSGVSVSVQNGVTTATIMISGSFIAPQILSITGNLNVILSLSVAEKGETCVLNVINANPGGVGDLVVTFLDQNLAAVTGDGTLEDLKFEIATALAETIAFSVGTDVLIQGCKPLEN